MLPRSLYTCSKTPITLRALAGLTHSVQPTYLLQNDSYLRLCAPFKPPWKNQESVRKRLSKFRITMSQEEKERKLDAIERSKREEKPEGLVAKLKFYIKRYWYIAIPVHAVNCSIWFVAIYLAFVVFSGVNVIEMLETLHMPDTVIEKIKNVPESAGHVVVALLLYKIATPFRYALTLALIRVTFVILRKCGWLKTAREIEFHVRNRYETLNRRRLSAASQLIERYNDKHIKRVRKSANRTK